MTVPRLILTGILMLALLFVPIAAEAQQPRLYRVGVVFQGGPYFSTIDGLRDGLRELGLEEGKQFVLHLRDTKGDLNSAAAAAKSLEAEKVDVIYALSTTITLPAKQATKSVPIVFYAGADPVAAGLVESFRKPGGRLTGIYGRSTDFTAKRLQLLTEMIPRLRRVVTFYKPDNPVTQRSVALARDAARQLKVELVERTFASVEELRAGLRALRAGEADAFFYVSDAIVNNHRELIIETARAKRLPTMFQEQGIVAKGALASYGVSYYAFGRLSARYVQRILLGADPGNIPVEQLDKFHFVINLKTAKALGLTIPQSVLIRADEVIE